MKKTTLAATSMTICSLVFAGILALCALTGCASNDSSSEQGSGAADQSTSEATTDYEKIMAANTLENLAGTDGTLACTMETYDEESTLEDTTAIEWKMTGGKPSIQWKSTMDGETQYSMSEYSTDDCGAIYTTDEGDKYVSIYAENDFVEGINDEWTALIEYEGNQSEVVTNGNTATLEVTQETEEGDDSYYKATYTFDPNTYVLSSVEIGDYSTEDNKALERVVIKDITTQSTFDLGTNPYQDIAGVSDDKACNLTVVVNPISGDQITSTYKVSRDSIVDLLIAEDFDLYSDEAMTTVIDEIDVDTANATVYVQVKETTEDDEGTEDGEDTEGDLDLDANEDQLTAEDGSVITLGDDGKYYDEDGNEVTFDDVDE